MDACKKHFLRSRGSLVPDCFCNLLLTLYRGSHVTISCIPFATYLENDFSFFYKSLKILSPQFLFFEVAYGKYGIKKI